MELKNSSDKKGVTLIELLVAVAIFSLAMTAVSGIFINTIKEQQKMSAKQAVTDNVRYAMGFMVKELRMAKSLTTVGGNYDAVTFTNSANNPITYSLNNSKVMRNGQPISSDEISIGPNGLNFHVNNWNLTAGPAPVITIYIKAERAGFPQNAVLELQSTVSLRLY